MTDKTASREATQDEAIQDKVKKTDAEWRQQLTAEQYQVARGSGTERARSPVHRARPRSPVSRTS